MNNITLGKYVPYNSLIHKLDARGKILSMILLMVCIFFKFPDYHYTDFQQVERVIPAMSFLVYGIIFIMIIIIMKMAHIKITMLFKQLKAMWIMIIVLLIINILVPSTNGVVLFNIGSLKIYDSSIYNTIYIIVRLIIMIGLTLVLTATTKPLEITNALEWLMAPLKVIKFPVHEIAMTISLALRFIPTLLEETQRIMKAQASRGVDFQHGKFKEKIRAIISLIIPLFISAFQRSEELANAMEARGYDPSAKRTKYRLNKWHLRDTVCGLVILVLFSSLLTLRIMGVDLVLLIGGLF